MGIAELHKDSHRLIIRSIFHFYGEAATKDLSLSIASNIADHWNEPEGKVLIRKELYDLRFEIEAIFDPGLLPETVWYNSDPRLNFFRIEEFSLSDISFADGLGSNTGYFKLGNILNNSTTAAHEYGHTLGLGHPENLDIRGNGQPGIMYPRGTICDPAFQYDPSAEPLAPGGTLNPFTRKVLTSDLEALRLHRISFDRKGVGVVGGFSSHYHERHER